MTEDLSWAELPTVITAYLPAHEARDTDSAVSAFAATPPASEPP
ncbi:hypothetical protein [Actinoplanes solisilvae]|nr:hypothetical protein [Actinoplanes solisilvae]